MSNSNYKLPITNNIGLWFDAADKSSIILSGSTVTQWNDKSGNGFDAVNSSNAGPKYSPTGFNGLPGLLFDGKTTLLRTEPISPMPALSVNGIDTTIFIVFNKVSAALSPEISYLFNLYYENFGFYIGGSSSSVGHIYAGNGSANLKLPITGPQIMSIQYNNALNTYNNGIINSENTVHNTKQLGKKAEPFPIGGQVSAVTGAGFPIFNSYIAELIIYNVSLTTSEIQEIEGYLACKWNLQSQLSSLHPYSITCPFSSLPPSLPPPPPLPLLPVEPVAEYTQIDSTPTASPAVSESSTNNTMLYIYIGGGTIFVLILIFVLYKFFSKSKKNKNPDFNFSSK